MSLRITGRYNSAQKGETLYITTDGQLGAITAFSGLDQIGAAAMYLRKCQHQSAVIAAGRNCFEDRTLKTMRREARQSVMKAVRAYLRGVIALRAGFVA